MSSYYFILSFILSEYHCIIFIYPRKERLDHWVIGYACVCIQSCVGADFSLQVAKKTDYGEGLNNIFGAFQCSIFFRRFVWSVRTTLEI